MAKVLILGDPHLGGHLNLGKPGIGSSLNSKIIDQFNILDWVLDQALQLLVTDIFITGDIFDQPNAPPTIISLFIDWLKKCSEYNIKIHIIVGNHDILRSGQFYTSSLDIISSVEIPNISIYKTISNYHMDDISFTLIPFRDRRSFNTDVNADAIQALLDKIPYFLNEIPLTSKKVMIGHLTIDSAIPIGDEFDDLSNELFCPLEMFNGYDYTWFGHVHKPQVLKKKPYVSHIGSMELSNFYEADHKKILIFIDTSKEEFFEKIDLPVRLLKQMSISIPDGTDDSTRYVIDEIDKMSSNIAGSTIKLNITFNGENLLPINRKIIEEKLISMGVFHIYRISEERSISNIKKTSSIDIDSTMNTATAVRLYAEENIEQEIRDKFISLSVSIIDEFHNNIKD